MIKIILVLFYFIVFFNQAFATTLTQALKEAYNNNPRLNAERKNLEIAEQKIKQAKGEFLPNITISGYISDENTTRQTDRKGGTSESNFEPTQQKLLIEQSLYEGKGRYANLKKNDIGYDLAKLRLKKTEQEILFESIEAYTNLVLSNKKIRINKENLNLLERQVETDKSRLERGEINLTDLAEASLAGARAKLIEAENKLVTSRLNYEKTIGKIDNYKNLLTLSSFSHDIPRSLALANQISQKENPNLNIAILELPKGIEDNNDYLSTLKEKNRESISKYIRKTLPKDCQKISKKKISGNFVLIGTSALGLKDIRSTPLDATIPGVEVHANVLENVLTGNQLSRPPDSTGIEILEIFFAGILLIILMPITGAYWSLIVVVSSIGVLAG